MPFDRIDAQDCINPELQNPLKSQLLADSKFSIRDRLLMCATEQPLKILYKNITTLMKILNVDSPSSISDNKQAIIKTRMFKWIDNEKTILGRNYQPTRKECIDAAYFGVDPFKLHVQRMVALRFGVRWVICDRVSKGPTFCLAEEITHQLGSTDIPSVSKALKEWLNESNCPIIREKFHKKYKYGRKGIDEIAFRSEEEYKATKEPTQNRSSAWVDETLEIPDGPGLTASGIKRALERKHNKPIKRIFNPNDPEFNKTLKELRDKNGQSNER